MGVGEKRSTDAGLHVTDPGAGRRLLRRAGGHSAGGQGVPVGGHVVLRLLGLGDDHPPVPSLDVPGLAAGGALRRGPGWVQP